MTERERMFRSERRFGRLEAYEQVLHYASLLVLVLGALFFGTSPGCFLGCLAVATALHALWSRVVDEEDRQNALVMSEEWEELERLVGE